MDGLVAALGTSQDQKLFFPSGTTVAGGWLNLSTVGSTSFGTLATPTAFGSGGSTYTQTAGTAGYPIWSAATGGASTYLGRSEATFATAGTLFIYDLLWGCSGFSGTSTTAQSVVSFSGMPTRNTTGAGAEIWVVDFTATGATASNITVQYTNQASVSGRNTVSTAMIASMPAGRMFQVPLQSGDTGVSSVQSVTLSASTGTAGNFGVLVMNRESVIGSAVPNTNVVLDFASTGMPKLSDSAVLMFVCQGTATSTGIITGQFDIIQG
jgi:hypothetical protein